MGTSHEQSATEASAGACANSLRFDDMAALTGCGIDFATACAAPTGALRSARRSYPAQACESEMLWKALGAPASAKLLASSASDCRVGLQQCQSPVIGDGLWEMRRELAVRLPVRSRKQLPGLLRPHCQQSPAALLQSALAAESAQATVTDSPSCQV